MVTDLNATEGMDTMTDNMTAVDGAMDNGAAMANDTMMANDTDDVEHHDDDHERDVIIAVRGLIDR